MPKLRGLFDHFPKLGEVTAEGVAAWHDKTKDPERSGKSLIFDENRLGNRILYSSAVPYSADDLAFDLAILREALKTQPQDFLNQNLRLIYIPQEFEQYFPDLKSLAAAFTDALKPQGVTSVVLKLETLGLKNLGSIIRPEITDSSGVILITIHDRKYEVKVGSLTVIPAESSKVDINFQSRAAKLLGSDNTTLEVAGGKMGLLVDARR